VDESQLIGQHIVSRQRSEQTRAEDQTNMPGANQRSNRRKVILILIQTLNIVVHTSVKSNRRVKNFLVTSAYGTIDC